MSIKLKPITNNSWIVTNDTANVNIGLLSQQIDSSYLLVAKSEKICFTDRLQVNKYFMEDVFDNVSCAKTVSAENTVDNIKGYPVHFDHPHEVTLPDVNLPLFSKKSTSDTYYCAGYYCLNFPKNWMPAFCPKLSTLETYKYAGPYRSELEMKTELNKLRKAKQQLK